MPELHAVEAWMLGAMTGAEAPGREDAAAMVRSTPGLAAAERIALYRRGYRARLVEVMRAQHPALRHALGAELFDAFALEYLSAHPSRSYTLALLGAGFADHLEATRPAGDELWPEFLVDLARLERAFYEVYEGPGTEGEAPPGPGAQLGPAPCLRLVRSRFPVGDYLLAVRRGEEPELPAPRTTGLALSRRDYVVTLTEIDEAGYAALDALLAGEGAARAAAAAGLVGEEMETRVRDWADRGFLRALGSDNEGEPTR